MAKAPVKKSVQTKPPVDMEERKRKQYQEALSRRGAAHYGIQAATDQIKKYKVLIDQSQNRIDVLEFYFSTLRSSNPVVENFIMDAIEEENVNIRSLADGSAGYRESLRSHREEYAEAERIISSIVENGPDMQDKFEFDHDDDDGDYSRDNKSRAAGR